MAKKQKIVTNLWFDKEAEEAAKFYCKVFKRSKINRVTRWGDVTMGDAKKGDVLTVEFQLEGQQFLALNGGPQFQFTEAISLAVSCDSQKEVDRLWKKLLEGGGQESQCGWLKDKYGLSWQVVPETLVKLMRDKNAKKAAAVTQAMLQMQKIDIAKLKAAYKAA